MDPSAVQQKIEWRNDPQTEGDMSDGYRKHICNSPCFFASHLEQLEYFPFKGHLRLDKANENTEKFVLFFSKSKILSVPECWTKSMLTSLIKNISGRRLSNSLPPDSLLAPTCWCNSAWLSISEKKRSFQVSANVHFLDVSASNLVIISFLLLACSYTRSVFGWDWHLPQCLMSVFHFPVLGPMLLLKPLSSYLSVCFLSNTTSSHAPHSKKMFGFSFHFH